MRLLVFLAGLFALLGASLAAGQSTPPPAPEESGGQRIVGGNKAPGGTAPWQVEIYNTGQWTAAMHQQDRRDEIARNGNSAFADKRPVWDLNHICGGVLIASGWVLTAGHCLQSVPDGVADPDAYFRRYRRIRIGTQDISPASGRTCAIAQTIIYPEADDVGLIRFDPGTCIPASSRIRGRARAASPKSAIPIRIAGTRAGDPLSFNSGTSFQIYGWGMTLVRPVDARDFVTSSTRAQDTAAFLDPDSQDLKVASIQYVPPAACPGLDTRGYRFKNGLFCAGVAAGKVDSCQGDSGGPLVLSVPQADGSAEPLLVGVVKGGNGCGLDHSPGFYVYAPAYLKWIAGNIAPRHDLRKGLAMLAATS